MQKPPLCYSTVMISLCDSAVMDDHFNDEQQCLSVCLSPNKFVCRCVNYSKNNIKTSISLKDEDHSVILCIFCDCDR